MTSTVLSPIGKGQITIPHIWRKKLGIIGKSVKAEFTGKSVIISPIETEGVHWEVNNISLNQLNQDTRDLVKQGREDYKSGNTDKFFTFSEVFED